MTIEEIKKDIERLDRELEEHRQERIAAGMQPEEPAPFISREAGALLSEKVRRVRDYSVRVAALMAKGHTADEIGVDYAWLAGMHREADMLRKCVAEEYADQARIALRIISNFNKLQAGIMNEADVASDIHMTVRFEALIAEYYSEIMNEKVIPALSPQELAELIADPERVARELAKANADYDAVKHELDWMLSEYEV
ncbi:hypothetical protein [Aneurinibacillus sp. REN35]|uniref:hypothetical protein n=1 Tax=Aneurinibacillus sp. REN35 TaxID=3237286 RepID=UPI003526DD6E